MAIPNAEGDLVASERKLNKIDHDWGQSLKKWRTEKEQKVYTSKLLDTLRRVRSSTPATHGLRRSRVIREAADRCLAVAARGRTRWSRAILSNRKLFLKRRRPPSSSLQSTFYTAVSRSKKKNSPILVGKAAFLGRLVPGGRKLSFPMLLVEASDYIAALQMQVRAMSALTTVLSASGKTLAESDGFSL
ncbi:transcription factor bHLH148-like [Phalaenopsis equestris]|uniref:transcription factor bHLH148-like n=1 Tax=Phalaenopsis equestris TaxID=78828 RepID=UPI0009E50FC8|nr:transcription factor bHLH148-like [Phalaenopsis equestris]XP_020591438.1 transcription factor bHLH148-like [Phalaenopsis equestris]